MIISVSSSLSRESMKFPLPSLLQTLGLVHASRCCGSIWGGPSPDLAFATAQLSLAWPNLSPYVRCIVQSIFTSLYANLQYIVYLWEYMYIHVYTSVLYFTWRLTYIGENIWCVSLRDWLISLSIMVSGWDCFVESDRISFSLIAE